MQQTYFSPRPWGCSAHFFSQVRFAKLFPTPVGMLRSLELTRLPAPTFPHARGDAPQMFGLLVVAESFSPRPWGCSVLVEKLKAAVVLFPTPVGMLRQLQRAARSSKTFPHARGDAPETWISTFQTTDFSPRPWGCSDFAMDNLAPVPLFPTPVGMLRFYLQYPLQAQAFPHSRGDAPQNVWPLKLLLIFSPLPWGCSGPGRHPFPGGRLFPTPVGMLRFPPYAVLSPDAFPHSRGDAPVENPLTAIVVGFSPLPWGCSGEGGMSKCSSCLFPTPVGMLRRSHRLLSSFEAFPHSRGDAPSSGAWPEDK